MWNANCFEHTQEPFIPLLVNVGGKYDSTSPVSVSCTDKRNNHPRTLDLYSEVREVLEWCLDNDIVLTVCSKSPDKSLVESILKAFNMWDWFLLPQVFTKRKSYHFRNLSECTGLKMEEFLFFDDEPANIDVCSAIGVTSCLVPKGEGLTWRALSRGLEMFYSKQSSSSCKRTSLGRSPKKVVSWGDAQQQHSASSESSVSIVSSDSDLGLCDSMDSADSHDITMQLFSEYMREGYEEKNPV